MTSQGPRTTGERGAALVFALLLTLIAAAIAVSSALNLNATRGQTEIHFSLHGQARQIAQSGLTEALSWLGRQNAQPVRAFEPRLEPTVTPPVLETLDPEIGLVREFEIRGDLWGRYEVWKEWPDDPDPERAALRSVLAARDISAQRSTTSSVSSWLVRSVGYVFRRTTAAAAFDEPPNRVVAMQALETEYARPLFQLPAQAALSAAMGGPVVVGPNSFVYGGGSAAGIYYQTGTGAPNTVNGTLTGNPELSPTSVFNCEPMAVFGVSEATLRTMATHHVTDEADFPVPVPDFAIVFVDDSVHSLDFRASRPLLGTGLVYVKGNVAIRTGSNSSFKGLLYVHGHLVVHGEAHLTGSVVAMKGVSLLGNGGPVTLTYDAGVLEALQRHFASYRLSAPIRQVHGAPN